MQSQEQKIIDIFTDENISIEDIYQLCTAINSKEAARNEFAGKLQNCTDDYVAGLGNYILGQYQKAAELLEKAPDSKEKFMILGNTCAKLRKYEQAEKEYDKAQKAGADKFLVALAKAEAMTLAGQCELAEKILAECANFDGVSADYHYQLGRLSDAKGEYEQALEHYHKAIELDQNHKESLFRIAYCYDLRGEDEAAVDYYRQLISISPTSVNAMLNLAVLYEDIGKYELAMSCIDSVLKYHPNHKKAQLFKKDISSSMVMIYDEEKERKRDKHNKILEIPISDFELSVRSRNCLKKMNITTIGDLLQITEAELLSYKNFGETSLNEIKKILETKGLNLGMSIENGSVTQTSAPEEIEGADDELARKSVDELELSVRARRCLTRLGVRTLAELVSKTEAELLGCKNFGVTSLNEIKEKLTEFGLSLRTLE